MSLLTKGQIIYHIPLTMKKTRIIYLIIGIITACIAVGQDLTFDKVDQKASFGSAKVFADATEAAQPQSSLIATMPPFTLNHLSK